MLNENKKKEENEENEENISSDLEYDMESFIGEDEI